MSGLYAATIPTSHIDARCAALWKRAQELYEEFQQKARLDNLNKQMLSWGSPSYKLRCHGEECKGMVPVVEALAKEKLEAGDQMQLAVLQATIELAQCYKYAADRSPEAPAALADNSRRFCTLWVTLENLSPDRFRVKPTMHLFQEMCEVETQGRPAANSTYRDEEFGGSLVALGRRRGGSNTPSSVGTQCLLKFCAKHRVPSF